MGIILIGLYALAVILVILWKPAPPQGFNKIRGWELAEGNGLTMLKKKKSSCWKWIVAMAVIIVILLALK